MVASRLFPCPKIPLAGSRSWPQTSFVHEENNNDDGNT